MKQPLILLFALLSLASYGQNFRPIPLDIKGYRGNPIQSDSISLAPSDTLPGRATVSAKPAIGSGPTSPQPVLVHKGLKYVVRFATSETLPELSIYELKVSGVTKYTGSVIVNKQQVVVVPNIPATTLSYIYSRFDALTGRLDGITAGEVTLPLLNSFKDATRLSLDSLRFRLNNITLTPGPQGPQGIPGIQGAQGPAGANGVSIIGSQGPKGDKGDSGAQGIQGPKGDTGLTGAAGPTGAVGQPGAQGIQGIQGIVGATGPQGPKGDTGATGLTGPKGDTGAQGIAGTNGADGATGAQGPKGDTGAQGPQGVQGPKGDTGAQGPAGSGVVSTTTVQGVRDAWPIVYVTTPTLANVQAAIDATNGTGKHIIVTGGTRAITDKLNVTKPKIWLQFKGANWTRTDDVKMVELNGDNSMNRFDMNLTCLYVGSAGTETQGVFSSFQTAILNDVDITNCEIQAPFANSNCIDITQYSSFDVSGSKKSRNLRIVKNRLGPVGRMGVEVKAQVPGAVTDVAYLAKVYVEDNVFNDLGRLNTNGHGMAVSIDAAGDSLYVRRNKAYDANNKTWEVVNGRNIWISDNYALNTKNSAVTGVSITAGNWPKAVNVVVENNETFTTGTPYNFNDIRNLRLSNNIGINRVNTQQTTNNGVTLTRVDTASVNSNVIRVAGNRALYLENTTSTYVTSNTITSEFNFTDINPVYLYGSSTANNYFYANKLAKYPGSFFSTTNFIQDVSGNSSNIKNYNEIVTEPYPRIPSAINTTGVILKLDGQGNSTTDVFDSSPNPKPVGKVGNVVNSTAQFKYGGSSLYFDGSSSLVFPKSSDFDLGTADFTIEAWIYPTAAPGSNLYPSLVMRQSATSNTSWLLGLKPSLAGADFNIQNSTNNYQNPGPSTSTSTPINTWTHVALVSSGGVRKMYQNGVLTGTATSNPSMELSGNATGLVVGAQNQYPFYQGYMHLRLTKGLALYTDAFTPPTTFTNSVTDGETPVATFALAKAAITLGTKRVFLITNNELYGAPTRSIYDGTNWYHSPADQKNN